MDRSNASALLGAASATLLAIFLLYCFFDRIWPILPAWIAVPLCILVAALAIGSPIYTLLRLSDRMYRKPGGR